MKIVTSKCEEDFVANIIAKGQRLDGRGLHDGRAIEIAFGSNGSCIVVFDNTRVLAQVSCELTAPRLVRPSEGALYVNFELSPMAAPDFKSGRMSDVGIEASRLLERSVRDSRCIDLESLCVVAGMKVWTIRVDVQALNNDGNLTECASIATIAALAHFRRPHVAVVGTDVTVHSLEDHNPVPLSLHHMPIIVSLALFGEDDAIVVDPVELEERVCKGKIVIGVNAHQELCSFHLSGAMMLKKDTVLQSSNIAVKRAQMLTQKIRVALDNDAYCRATNQQTGFVSLLRTGTILGAKRTIPQVTMTSDVIDDDMVEEVTLDDVTSNEVEEKRFVVQSSHLKEEVKKFLQDPEIALFEGGSSRWQLDDEDDESDDDDADEMEEEQLSNDKETKPQVTVHDLDDDSDNEKVYLKADPDANNVTSRGWYSENAFLRK